MHSVIDLEKQQVGLRLHKYLVDEIDDFTKRYSLNRTDIIEEAIKSYLEAQKSQEIYGQFDEACKEIVAIETGDIKETQTLSGLINELENSTP